MTLSDDDIRQLTQTVWEAITGIPLTAQSSPTFASGARTVAACVQIAGAWNGAVLLQCPERAAREAAASIFQSDPSKITVTDMQEAIAEMANMVAGNIKALLPEPSHLSLPSVVEGGDFSSRIPGSRPANRIVLACNGQDVAVTVLESVRNSGAVAPASRVA